MAQAFCWAKIFATAKALDELYEAILLIHLLLLLLLLLFWMFADRWRQGGQTLVGVVSLWFLKFNIHWALAKKSSASLTTEHTECQESQSGCAAWRGRGWAKSSGKHDDKHLDTSLSIDFLTLGNSSYIGQMLDIPLVKNLIFWTARPES